MEQFLAIVDKLGFPAAAFVVFALAAWRIIVWVGNNVLLPITKKHIEMIDEAKTTSQANATTLTKMSEVSEVTGRAIVRIADQHEESLKLTRQIHDKLVGGDKKP